jgi:Na+-transporting NADH:ubiquinone oxidoreductase subunit A
MAYIRIKKGHDLNIAGKPEYKYLTPEKPTQLFVNPLDFNGIKPKILVKKGDQVKIGSKLFFDKLNPEVFFVSPGGGTISEIKLGERRRVERITIDLDDSEKYEELTSKTDSNSNSDEIIKYLLESGLFTTIRQRPYSKIPNPKILPKAIFVSMMPTAPFAPDHEFVIEDITKLQEGFNVLSKLTSGSVNVVVKKDSTKFNNLNKIELHQFKGPHPAGNVGIQIHHIDPINIGETVWYISPQDVIAIGELFLTGKYSTTKTITVGGSELTHHGYVKIRKGQSINSIISNETISETSRVISGDVLAGEVISVENPIRFYDEIISVICDGGDRELLGWAQLGMSKYSLSNTFVSRLFGYKKSNFDTRLNGGERAIVPFGSWEAMIPMDIIPTYLIKSILARDIEEMEKLGIYECAEEDFALAAYSCPSKVELLEIVRQGLEFIEKEG